ncbi:hypothetical protein VQ02_05865 [Methylobacterium variabile]|jgi:hypothetical protein|uniref:Uncharacterized protein n=1 Tax=Methylobacterium variabile TaxID=298794 RepID=A0A0J6T6V2_9HYPH|nr:hypothetical protein [Methylobacterium variabile]KMO41273.1 hypothetical protein VQ02_05865 [Methylobacterium variabile]
MALTNDDFRRMIAETRRGTGQLSTALQRVDVEPAPVRVPRRVEPEPRLPVRLGAREVHTVEIVWAPAYPRPDRRPGHWLGALATVAKVLALPILLVGSLYAKPLSECRKQKSHGMLYYGTTVEMCVNERMAEGFGSVQAFVDRQMRAM